MYYVNISGRTVRVQGSVLLPKFGGVEDHKPEEGTLYIVSEYHFDKYKDIRSDIAKVNDYGLLVFSDPSREK